MTYYRIVIDGRLTARLANSLEGVAIDADDAGTALLVDVASAVDLDGLLQRLGDLGLNVVSLDQQPAPT